MEIRIGVLGLGYVGLPLALAFSEKYPHTVGFDINEERVSRLKSGIDDNNEGLEDRLKGTKLKITADIKDLSSCTILIVGVPTPVDINNTPDLEPLRKACASVGKVLRKGAVVVF